MNSVPLKVCLVAPVPPPYGGIANWTRLMLNYTPKSRVKIDIIDIAPKKRALDGRNLFDRVFVSGFDMFRKYLELKKNILKKTPDVIHITTSGSLAIFRDILLLRLAKNKRIHSIYHIRFGRISDLAKNNTFEWRLFVKATSLASKVIVIDNQTYNTIRKRLPKVKVVLIPNPIMLDELPTHSSKILKNITFLGWVIQSKGIEELLLAWRSIYDNNRDWQLNLIGPYHKDYICGLKSHFSFEGVNLIGEKLHDDAMNFLNNSAIFVLPSYTEGFPNVVLEAMTLQKAIIATKVGAIPEMLSDDCGLLVDVKNSDDLEKKTRMLMMDIQLREKLGMNAFKKAKTEYSFEVILEKYIETWRSYENNI